LDRPTTNDARLTSPDLSHAKLVAWHSELAARWQSLERILAERRCDVGLVFGSQGRSEHVRYLTNFVPSLGDSWIVVPSGGPTTCVLNFDWELSEARQRSGIEGWRGEFDSVPVVIEALVSARPARVGVAGLERLPSVAFGAIRKRLPKADFQDIGAELASLRRRKSKFEVELLQQAAAVTDRALQVARETLRPGITEHQVVGAMAAEVEGCGATWSFRPAVVSGEGGEMIREPSDRLIKVGDAVMIDIGAEVDGYQADATRTFVLGAATAEQRNAWDILQRAWQAAIRCCRPGIPCIAAHQAAAEIIEAAGFNLRHRIGHGIGLATSFEWPSLDRELAEFEPGMTICVEPGIYRRGLGSMKLEDDLVITDAGCDLLTHALTELEVPVDSTGGLLEA
jgi:Xaa-Pro aminopeptidase